MADAERKNAGKPKLSYWLSMQASTFIYSGDTWDDGFVTETDRALDLEKSLGIFTRGHDNEYLLLDELMACVGGRDRCGAHFTAACEFGAGKYKRDGFMLGFPISTLIDAAARHLKAIRTTGADYEESYVVDGETVTVQCNHWDNVCWNIVMIYEHMYYAPERDDRLFHFGDYSGAKRRRNPPPVATNKDLFKTLAHAPIDHTQQETTVPAFVSCMAAAERLADDDGDYDCYGAFDYI